MYSGRKEICIDPSGGPGTYDRTSSFENLHGGFTIGKKYIDKKSYSPGPGEYNPEKADGVTRPKSACINIYKKTEKSKSNEFSLLGPGAYEVAAQFGESTNKMTIGERR